MCAIWHDIFGFLLAGRLMRWHDFAIFTQCHILSLGHPFASNECPQISRTRSDLPTGWALILQHLAEGAVE